MKKQDVGDLLNRMWVPVRDELSQVVRMGGRVTSATSVWTRVPNLYKQETPTTFHEGMERYVNQRAKVAALVASATTTEESRQQQEIEQQDLLLASRYLLEEAKKIIYYIPGSEAAVSRAEAARPRPSAQQARPAATKPSATSSVVTGQPSSASRPVQSQSASPARIIYPRPAPPRPAPAPMRTAETVRRPSAPQPPSRPATTPLRITDTPKTPEPAVATPTPPEPMPSAPPSVPPVTSPVAASAPEPTVAAPLPPEPPVPPSVPPVPGPSTASAAEPGEVIKPSRTRRCRALSQRAGACRDFERPTQRPAVGHRVGVRGPVQSQHDELRDQPAVRRPVQGRDGPVEGHGAAREHILVRLQLRGRRRNKGGVRCLRGEATVREPLSQGLRAASGRGRRRPWSSLGGGRTVRRPPPHLRGLRETPVCLRRPHRGLIRRTFVPH